MLDSILPENPGVLLVEISKYVLESQNEIWLRLNGNCMWPVVCGGDEVKVQKSSYGSLKFGDVAIYQTTPQTFHANILFRKLKQGEKFSLGNFLGKVVQIRRRGKILDLERRGFAKRLLQALIAPANPYALGFPAFAIRRINRKH